MSGTSEVTGDDSTSGVPSRIKATAQALWVYIQTLAGMRNVGTANDYLESNEAWNYTLITGGTGDLNVTTSPALIKLARVAGTANLAGAVVVKDGANTIETIALASAPGTERRYDGAKFLNGIKINLANAADVMLVEWKPL